MSSSERVIIPGCLFLSIIFKKPGGFYEYCTKLGQFLFYWWKMSREFGKIFPLQSGRCFYVEMAGSTF